LPGSLANALYDPAMDLALEKERVDGAAEIVDDVPLSSLSSSETPGVSAKPRASAAWRWHSSIKWLLCSTVTSASLFLRLFYDFIASSSWPLRFVPHGRASEAEAEGDWGR
jgi:hypothetical protein